MHPLHLLHLENAPGSRKHRGLFALVASVDRATIAQSRSSIDQFLAPGYPFELVAAKKADRIA